MARAVQPVEAEAATWPRRPSAILDWLARDARQLPSGAALLNALCVRLLDADIPLARVSFHIRTLHPQLFALGFYWHRGADQIRVFQAKHGIKDTPLYQRLREADRYSGLGMQIDFSASNANEAIFFLQYRNADVVLYR